MSAVSLQGLHIRFGAHDVIRALDLEVAEGEFLVLLGPSGCGKSTLLHSIAGLVDVAGGRVHIGGHDMTDAEPSARGIGMVFQSYALYPTMTVERNLSFGLRVAGLPRAEIEARVGRAAEMLQLQPLLRRKPAQLSGGQRQRVAIGRALVRQARVFLLDEPLSNLDAQLRTELRREIKLLHRSLGSTMIYVTHDQVEAMTLATRIVVMREGVIQQLGTPAEVYAQPHNLFVASFLGAPAINRIDGRLRQGAQGLEFTAPGLALGLAGRPLLRPPATAEVTLALRPEHLCPAAAGTLQGRVQLVEPMGNHHVLWIEFAGQVLACLVHGAPAVRAGDALRFDVDTRQALLFDRTSGERLATGELPCH